MERRLAAVLAFDMVGYSRLMGVDEQGTLAAFRRHRRELFNPRAAQYHGRIVKFTGDGALMEFASVVDSVCFAVEVQLALRDENADLPEERQFRYRIGINIGDIIPDDGDIYGDGVNVAARLEELADPGGICLSGSAFDQVRGKLDLTFERLGRKAGQEHRRTGDSLSGSARRKGGGVGNADRSRHRLLGRTAAMVAAAAVVLLLLFAGTALWWRPWMSGQPPTAVERFAYPLPDKPSIAVLPFINVSSDTEQDHLAEGLTDDLITELSKVSGLFVIARHSVFALEDKAGNIQDVAAELGVHFVLEGTLQRAESRLRINVKLIDALTGLSMWAERYDRQYADIFAVQDDVIGKIISALAVKLNEGERDQLAQIPTDNLEAYDYYLRAEQEGFLYSDVETYRRTLSYYQKAIDLDPDFADAHAGIARVAVDVWRNDYNQVWSAAVARKIAYDAAGQALKLDPDNARAHTVLALLQLVDGRHAEAIDSANQGGDGPAERCRGLRQSGPGAGPYRQSRTGDSRNGEGAAARSCAAIELPAAGRRGLLHGARERTRHPAAGSGARWPAHGRTGARISGSGLCPSGRPAARGAGSGEAAGAVSRQQSDLLQLSIRLLARGGSALPSDGSRAGRHPGMASRLRGAGSRPADRRRTARTGQRQDLDRQAQERHRLHPVFRQDGKHRLSQRQHQHHRRGGGPRRPALREVRGLFPGPHGVRIRLPQHDQGPT